MSTNPRGIPVDPLTVRELEARIAELEAELAEGRRLGAASLIETDEQAARLVDAEARLAAVIAELHRLRVEWPQDAEWSDLEGIRAAAEGN